MTRAASTAETTRDTVVVRAQLKPADLKRLRTRAARDEVTVPVLIGQLVRDGLKGRAK